MVRKLQYDHEDVGGLLADAFDLRRCFPGSCVAKLDPIQPRYTQKYSQHIEKYIKAASPAARKQTAKTAASGRFQIAACYRGAHAVQAVTTGFTAFQI